MTVDGTDGCKIYKVNQDRDCGISTRGLGNLMLEIFHATSAMSMDQVITRCSLHVLHMCERSQEL